MDAILLGIDGTGDLSDASYRQTMHNSFVSYIVRTSPAKVKRYERGPAWDGLDMAVVVAKGYAFVHLNLVTQPKSVIYLAGYSRGGAGVVGVAQRLKKDGVNVAGMVLFDAVDRAIGIDAAEIPNNVEHVVHARRAVLARSRGSFGNCATRWRAPTRCDMRFFRGTHGAMGGVASPVPPGAKKTDIINEGLPELQPTTISYTQDAVAAREVWGWASPRVHRLGFLGSAAGARTIA